MGCGPTNDQFSSPTHRPENIGMFPIRRSKWDPQKVDVYMTLLMRLEMMMTTFNPLVYLIIFQGVKIFKHIESVKIFKHIEIDS